jgi:hypothetical protein
VYDPAMDDGLTTRAIRAATRVPRVDQPPSSVPIYRTITFSSVDADELGAPQHADAARQLSGGDAADLRADVEAAREAARATSTVAVDATAPTPATA